MVEQTEKGNILMPLSEYKEMCQEIVRLKFQLSITMALTDTLITLIKELTEAREREEAFKERR